MYIYSLFLKNTEINVNLLLDMELLMNQVYYHKPHSLHYKPHPVVIGFRLGSYCDGDLTVVPPYSCIQVQERMKQIVKVCNDIIMTSYIDNDVTQVLDNHIKHSPYRPFDTHLFKGLVCVIDGSIIFYCVVIGDRLQ